MSLPAVRATSLIGLESLTNVSLMKAVWDNPSVMSCERTEEFSKIPSVFTTP